MDKSNGEYEVYVAYGRIGSTLKTVSYLHSNSEEEAEAEFTGLLTDKTYEGYSFCKDADRILYIDDKVKNSKKKIGKKPKSETIVADGINRRISYTL